MADQRTFRVWCGVRCRSALTKILLLSCSLLPLPLLRKRPLVYKVLGSHYWRYVISSKDRRVNFYAILKTSEGDIRELWEKAIDADYEGIVVTLKKYDCESAHLD